MKSKSPQAISFKIPKSKEHALLVQVDDGPYFYDQLHYHPEYQITAILKGEGVLYAGNNMTSFSENDVLFIGSNIPHLLKNAPSYYTSKSTGVKGISLFFDEQSFGNGFFDIKELSNIKSLLQQANRVLKISGSFKEEIFQKIVSTTQLLEENLLITFFQILSLSHQAEKSFINSEDYTLMLNENEGGRLNEVLDYTFKHYNKEITIEQIAKISYLSRSQFSYFFKLHTGKSYIQFLTELRIENACVLLKNSTFTIEQICYESGFKNVSNFVRHFKKIKKTTPSRFRKLWGGKD